MATKTSTLALCVEFTVDHDYADLSAIPEHELLQAMLARIAQAKREKALNALIEHVKTEDKSPADSVVSADGDNVSGYVVVQEGGSTGEVYVHTFDTDVEADDYRVEAAKGGYRTSDVISIPASLDILGGPLIDLMGEVAHGVLNVDYVESDASEEETEYADA